MKMTHISANPLLSGECLLNITLEKGQNQAAQQLLDEIGTDVRLWDLDIKKTPKKRSLDSNSYYWVLCGKLAAKLKSTPIDIYRQHILDIGDNYEVLPIKDEAVDKFAEAWTKNGAGWVISIIGPSKLNGYTNLMAYYGSSTYDSKQMTRLIDLVVEDCKENGIETMTPGEIAQLNQKWKEG